MTADLTAALAETLAGHADCVLNDGQDLGAAATGQDVWSCGLVLPFIDHLPTAERAHVAAEQAKTVQAWLAGLAQEPEMVERCGRAAMQAVSQPHPVVIRDRVIGAAALAAFVDGIGQ